jgi:hypothetical protein
MNARRRKRTSKAKTPSDMQSLVDWRVGYHIEAAAKLVSASFNRIADAIVEANALQLQELAIRREHLLSVLESKTMADKAAQKIMGLMPDLGIRVHDLRGGYKPTDCTCEATDGKTCPIPFHQEVRGPEWVKDVLDDTITIGPMVHHESCHHHSSVYPSSRCRNVEGSILPETERYRWVQEKIGRATGTPD